MNLEQLKRQQSEKVAEMRSILTAVDSTEDKAITAEQEARYDVLEKEVDALNKTIERESKLQAIEARSAVEAPAVIVNRTADADDHGFRSFGEWFQELRSNPGSAKLQERSTTMGTQTKIGFVVPEAFSTVIRAVNPDEAIVRPRAQVIPTMEGAPDAPVHIPVLNQTDGVNSGVTVQWVGETDTRPNAGDPTMTRVTLTPQEANSYIDVSFKLLNNSEAAGELIERLLRQAIIQAEESAFMNGNGSGKPLGFLTGAWAVTAPRQTALSITYKDLVEMDARAVGGTYVWLASKAAKPVLRSLKDDAGNLIWNQNASFNTPSVLLGNEILFSEYQPAVGTIGDIALVNLNSYGIADGSPLTIFVDEVTQRGNGLARIYGSFNVDGRPLMTGPVKGADKVNRSAFINLATKLT